MGNRVNEHFLGIPVTFSVYSAERENMYIYCFIEGYKNKSKKKLLICWIQIKKKNHVLGRNLFAFFAVDVARFVFIRIFSKCMTEYKLPLCILGKKKLPNNLKFATQFAHSSYHPVWIDAFDWILMGTFIKTIIFVGAYENRRIWVFTMSSRIVSEPETTIIDQVRRNHMDTLYEWLRANGLAKTTPSPKDYISIIIRKISFQKYYKKCNNFMLIILVIVSTAIWRLNKYHYNIMVFNLT